MHPIVDCLVQLPNLHTLEVNTSLHGRSAVEVCFKAKQLPQVRTLVLDPDAHHIIRCCENVERVVVHRSNMEPVRYVESIASVKQSITRVALCAFKSPVVEGVCIVPGY